MVANLKPLFGLVIFIAAGRLEKAMTVRPIDYPFVHFSMWVFKSVLIECSVARRLFYVGLYRFSRIAGQRKSGSSLRTRLP